MPKDIFAPGAGSKPSSYADYPAQTDQQFVGSAKEILDLEGPSYANFFENMPLGAQGHLLGMSNAVKYGTPPPLPTMDAAEPWEMGPAEDVPPPQEMGMDDADAEAELEAMQEAEKPPKKARKGIKKPKKAGKKADKKKGSDKYSGGGGGRTGSRAY